MGILARYLVFEILRLLMPIWLALGFFLYVLEWFGQVFKQEAPASTIIVLYFYKIPAHLQICFPVAVLFASLVVLGHMNRSREVVAVQSMGVQPGALLLPALVAVAIASLPYYWVTTTLAPYGLRKHYELYDREILRQPSRFSKIRDEKIWFRNRDVLYNIGFFDHKKSELYDLNIYTFDDEFHIAQTIYAERATWKDDHWVLKKGTINVTDLRLEAPAIEHFVERDTHLIEAPLSLKRIEQNAETMNQTELSKFITRSHDLGINTSAWEVTYHSRYSFMLIAFVFLVLAFPVSMRFQRTGSRARDGTFVAGVSMLYWMIFNFSIGMGSNGKMNPVLSAWLPPAIFIFGIFLYFRRKNIWMPN